MSRNSLQEAATKFKDVERYGEMALESGKKSDIYSFSVAWNECLDCQKKFAESQGNYVLWTQIVDLSQEFVGGEELPEQEEIECMIEKAGSLLEDCFEQLEREVEFKH